MLRTVYVRYKNPFSRTDAEDTALYLTELLRLNPNGRFYLIVAENRMFAVGSVKEEKSERWTVKELRYIRDDQFRPYYLYFSPSTLPQGEYATTMYGGIRGKVEREKSTPLYFYLSECNLRLNTEQRQAGATKEAVWEVFSVQNTDGTATIRPLLSDEHSLMVVRTRDLSTHQLYTLLSDYVAGVFQL
jgi:hypothetical protein